MLKWALCVIQNLLPWNSHVLSTYSRVQNKGTPNIYSFWKVFLTVCHLFRTLRLINLTTWEKNSSSKCQSPSFSILLNQKSMNLIGKISSRNVFSMLNSFLKIFSFPLHLLKFKKNLSNWNSILEGLILESPHLR